MFDEEKLIKLAAQKHEIKLSSQDILQKYELEQQADAKKKRWIFSRPMLYTSGTVLTVCLLAALILPNVLNTNDPTNIIGVDSQEVTSDSTIPATTSIVGDSTQLAIAPGNDNEVVGFEILSSVELFDETSETTTNSVNTTTFKAREDDYSDEEDQGRGSSRDQEASFEDVVNSYEKIENIVYQASNIKDGIASGIYEGAYEGTYGTYTFKVVYQDSDIVLYYSVSEEDENYSYNDSYYSNGGQGMGDGDGDGDHQNANNHFGSKFLGEIVIGDKVYQTSGFREADEEDDFESINLVVKISDSKYYVINQMSNEGGFNYEYLLYENENGYNLPKVYYGISVTTFIDETFICSATIQDIQDSEDERYDFFVTQEGDYFDVEYYSRRDYRSIYLYYTVDGHKYVDQDTNEEITK